MPILLPALAAVMVEFRPLFEHRVFDRALGPRVGALLSVRTRTVIAPLRVTGHDLKRFPAYHHVLSRAQWSCREATQVLLGLVIDRFVIDRFVIDRFVIDRFVIDRFVPDGPVVVGLDDIIERRWGAKIGACDPDLRRRFAPARPLTNSVASRSRAENGD